MARRLLHRPSRSAPTAADRSFGTGPPHPELVALDLASGAVRFRRPADPPGIDPRAHNQRSALVLANGRVSVASGGRFGDCSRYQGWEWAASRRDGPVVSFRVPTAAERVFRRRLNRSSTARRTVGRHRNDSSSTVYDQGNSVLRLTELRQVDVFAQPAGQR
jgi:hypothetical protein